MKREELMIGDWYYRQDTDEKHTVQVTKETFALTDEELNNFEPIPITEDILITINMNPINNMHIEDVTYNYRDTDSTIRISRITREEGSIDVWSAFLSRFLGKTKQFPYINMRNCVNVYINYVHELQRALKVCGINKSINL